MHPLLQTLRRPYDMWTRLRDMLALSPVRMAGLLGLSLITSVVEVSVLSLVTLLATSLNQPETLPASLRALPGAALHPATPTVILSIISILTWMGLRILVAKVEAGMLRTAASTVRKQLLSAYLTATWSQQSSFSEGELASLLTSQCQRLSHASLALNSMARALLQLTVMLCTAFIVDWKVALAITGSTAVVTRIVRPFRRRASLHAQAYRTSSRAMHQTVASTTRLSQEVAVFGVRARQEARVTEVIDTDAAHTEALVLWPRIAQAVMAAVPLILVTLLLGIALAAQTTTFEDMTLLLLLLVRGASYGQQISQYETTLTVARPVAAEIESKLKRLRQHRETFGDVPLAGAGELEFKDVSFKYKDRGYALKGVSFNVPAGECIGIIGPSGAGKSTLTQLLLRLRSPTAGAVLLNGVPVRDYASEDWSKLVAYVPQSHELLAATVHENIAFLRDFSREQVIAAAKRAHLHDEIMQLPDGYDTMLGPLTNSLSGGQQQRLSLARALVARPAMLVLDEPTSALDMPSEAAVHETLLTLRGHITLFIIAHRLSTLNVCDRLLVLDRGEISALGTPADLEQRSEFYRRALELTHASEARVAAS